VNTFKKQFVVALTAATLSLPALAAQAPERAWHGQAKVPQYKNGLFPPWQGGDNNPVTQRGLEFTIPEVDTLPDFHGDPFNAKLVVFMGGNYYFAMVPLVKAFEMQHPEFKGRIYYETIPPGLLVRQIQAGGTITVQNMTWTVKPDVFTAGKAKVVSMVHDGMLQAPAVNFATNDLTIMVPRDNPAGVHSLKDLGKPNVRVVLPNPAWEGIASRAQSSLKKAGGAALETMVYETKVKDGTTLLTHIHHRQSPLLMMQGLADAGITWRSEARFMEMNGRPITHVDIPADENTTAIYSAAVVKGAPHPAAGKAWAVYLASPAAQQILARYGFQPPPGS